MTNRIRKAVFPVAGLGTRFLPATKAMPKEMLTVVDRPVIQHVVDEARAGGIEHFIFVTGRNKGVIEDHFDSQFELERTLEERGKKAELEALRHDLPKPGQTSFTRQQAPQGLGHAVWCAREIVGKEPFALLLPDVLHYAEKPCIGEMIAAYAKSPGNYIAVAPVPKDQTHQYGIVGVEDAARRGPPASPAWWRSRSPARRPPTCTSPGATSWSPRSSTSWARASAAPAARSRSPTP